ncbi:MAG: class I SAM-dependent methyltransferase [Solirubrobacteraceae bacterium]
MTAEAPLDPHSQAFWDDRYASRDQIWSGHPNAQLIAEAASLAPARALDVGTGEGADALWLAERGWQVTAVDLSPVALERGAARAAEHGDEVAMRIEWIHADIRTWSPPTAAYDLVSAHFLHPAPDVRAAVVGRLAAAVALGGILLYVGHDPADLALRKHRHPEAMVTALDIAQLLEPPGWDVEVAEARPRAGTLPDGRAATLHDAVLRARRAA